MKDCPFSHKVSKEKMPVCSYFLRGKCNRDDCPYLHVNVNRDAEICEDFVNGYCPLGDQVYEPQHDKTNKMTRAPSEDSDQPGHPPTAWTSTQSDQSELCTQWVTKDPRFLHVDSEDSDQTGRMPRLI